MMSEGQTAEQAWEEWQELTKQHLTPPDLWEYERVAFMAGWAARTPATGQAVQLTDDESHLLFEALGQFATNSPDVNRHLPDIGDVQAVVHPVVESILAARLSVVTTERDDSSRLKQIIELQDLLAAANARAEDWHKSATHRLNEGMKFRAERDAALARNTELERRLLIAEESGNAEAREHVALRAEMDNLRDRVTALADEWQRRSDQFNTDEDREDYAYFDGLAECSGSLRAAIVRGSDDEASIRADLTYGDERGDQ